ncbi:MBL fold metallo-hydrolase [uncultured Methylovirgula sp.]|uniref:MBL fold metallo-hydrolase n=1 Tax=uncultured Methylovirgula sp. TaxID=1285960 RepID=UPI002632D219|nr:MBL fold metallo-hydrolase [uncultured Methylovirgula sp.]
MSDEALVAAVRQVSALETGSYRAPSVECFFDEATATATYIVYDPETRATAVIDSVLNFDHAAARISFESADVIVSHVRARGLIVHWLLETHAHADHLSAAPLLKSKLGGRIAIGQEIIRVQEEFGKIFNAGTEFARDGSEFDRLFKDGEAFSVGNIPAISLHVPGHTPSDVAYIIGDAAFVGDTLFMPDCGTARADFPGGDPARLFESIRRLLSLPDQTRIFVCHDYKAAGRGYAWETTAGAERASNIHVRDGISEEEFVALRRAKDATLQMPKLILPSIQINMRGGNLPLEENNGVRYLKIPLNAI